MKNKIAKILLLSLFIILMSAFTSAEIIIQTYEVDYGFMMKTTPINSYNLCECESYTDYFIVENTGSYASTYSLELDSKYATLSTTQFELIPDQSMVVYLFIQAPCNKKVSEDIVITVKDLFRNTQELTKKIESGTCQNLKAELRTENEGTSNPCTPIEYEITVENTGVFTENYHIEFGADTYDEFFDIPYQDMTISAGKKGSVTATFTPECSISGDIIVPFTIEAENNKLIAELSHELKIFENYDFEVIAGYAEACTLKETQIPIIINNKANFENSYTIKLTAPKNFALSTEEISVKAESPGIINIIANPTQKQTGTQNIILTVTEETSGQVAKIETSIEAIICNDVSINIGLQEDIYDCAGKHYYPILLKNTGLVSEDIRVDVYGSEYVTATKENFYLEAGEETEVILVANLPPAHTLNTNIEVVATILGVETVTAKDTIHIKYINEQSCFEVRLLEQKTKMNFKEEGVTLTLKNIGLEKAKYDLSYEGEGFTLKDDDESLDAGEEKEIVLEKVNESEQRVYKGVLRASTTSDDEERTLLYELPVTINYQKETIFEKGRDYFKAQPCQFVSAALILLFIVGLIIIILRPDRPRRNGIPLLMILLGLWLIIAFIFLAIFGIPQMYENVKASEDPLVVVMAEDETYMLNLERYFIDEDGDTLDYLISDMDNVSVDISNGTAYITPDKDFFGSRRFRITAFDGNGGSTESPRMKLEVIDRPEYTGWAWYEHFCGYINVGLLLLVFFVASVLFKTRIRTEKVTEKKTEKKKPAKVITQKKVATKGKKSVDSVKSKKKIAVKKKKKVSATQRKKPSLPAKK